MTIRTPVEFWTLNNTLAGVVAGTTLASADGNNYYVDPGKVGQGWDFAYDTNRILSCALPAGMSFTPPWTFSCWYRPTDTANSAGSFAIATTGGAPVNIVDARSAFGWKAQVYIDGVKRAEVVVPKDTNWHHLAVSFDASGNVSIYVDNVKTTTASVAAPAQTASKIAIGGGLGLLAEMDCVGWWNVALSDAEVAELYNSGSGYEYVYTPPSSGCGPPRALFD